MKESGFSLMEVTVTVAILGIMGLAAAKFSQNAFDLKKRNEESSEFNSVQSNIKDIIQSKRCTDFLPFTNLNINDEGKSFTTTILNFGSLKNTKFSLVDIQKLKEEGGEKTLSSLLRLDYSTASGKRTVSKYVGVLHFKTDTSDRIILCSGSPIL